jgi:DNA repair protein RecN (Recombination protein N)
MPKSHLVELEVRKLGPVSAASLSLTDGFTVITGETGAGKTILVEALQLATGASEVNYASTDGLAASALFEGEGGEILLRREMTESGRLRSTINGSIVSAEQLRSQAEGLITIHGQHDSMLLKNKTECLHLIDNFGSIVTTKYLSLLEQLRVHRDHLHSLGGSAEDRASTRADIQAKIKLYESVSPSGPNELVDALARLSIVSNLLEQASSISSAAEKLIGEDSAADLVGEVSRLLQAVDSLQIFQQRCQSLLEELRDLGQELSIVHRGIDADGEEIEYLNERIRLLQGLSRRFGEPLSECVKSYDALLVQQSELDNAHEVSIEIESLISLTESELESERARLKAQRSKAAAKFSEQVSLNLARVALPHARFRVDVAGADGSDISFWFQANPGLREELLHQTASGGELSRVLLAISLISIDRSICAVFDEIDAGIGGAVGESIGDCLWELSRHQQVIVVTHLASIAAKADRHWAVSKQVHDGQTVISVRRVEGQDRIDEISRMLSGMTEVAESRQLAQKMLEESLSQRSAP